MNGSSRVTISLLLVLAGLSAAPPASAEGYPAPPGCPYQGTYEVEPAPGACHPYAQPMPEKGPPPKIGQGCPDACVSTFSTAEGLFPASNPWRSEEYLDPKYGGKYAGKVFPGTNFLPTIFTNIYDSAGNEVPNTLPSTPWIPYNLHDGEPRVSRIHPDSPTNDLFAITQRIQSDFAEWHQIEASGGAETAFLSGQRVALENSFKSSIQRAIDILEGNPVPNRAYSGFPLLHFHGPEKVKKVEPVWGIDARGEQILVGGNVDVHQIWYDQHIESDTAYLDPSAVQDVPWTVTYTVDVLDRGHDDFSPFAMFNDPYNKTPLVAMDQSFFNMEEGTRTVFKIKMPPGKYLNLVYTWGWRLHPPRVQAMENATTTIDWKTPECPPEYRGKTLPELEVAVFGKDPTGKDKEHAIAQIGALSPAKRMWEALKAAQKLADAGELGKARDLLVQRGTPAFNDWRDRTHLPDGVEPDPESDLTILFVNNTIYGQLTDGGWVRWDAWKSRYSEWEKEREAYAAWEQHPEGPEPPRPPAEPPILDVTILNGDHFVHGYANVDFGGNRGWENQFKSSVRIAGSGCWFTFGRVYQSTNAGQVCVPKVRDDGTPGRHKVSITYNFEPSRRVRFYQFDPFHHDVAVYSIH